MKRGIKQLGMVFLLLGLGGCASTRQYALPEQEKAPSARAIATIEVFRPSQFVGGAVGIRIEDGEKEIGRLGPGGVLSWQRPAGYMELRAYYFASGSSLYADLPVTVSENAVYRFKCFMSASLMNPQIKLELVEVREAGHMPHDSP
jgi:hypothetical protein